MVRYVGIYIYKYSNRAVLIIEMKHHQESYSNTSTAVDPWAGSLRLLMTGVSAAGIAVIALYR